MQASPQENPHHRSTDRHSADRGPEERVAQAQPADAVDSSATAAASKAAPRRLLEADLVVLGAGGTGIAAALAAAEAGRSVVLLEKGNKPGGASMFGATGLAAYGSEAQREAGEEFSAEDAVRAVMAHAGPEAEESLVRAVLERSADTLDWLAGHGLRTALAPAPEVPDAATERGAGDEGPSVLAAHRRARTYHRYLSKFGGFKKLLAAFAARGGVLLTETAATEVLTGPDGSFRGVLAESTPAQQSAPGTADGDAGPELIEVRAPALVIATGGHVGDPAQVQEDLGAVPAETVHFTGERKSVGTGRRLAAALGADVRAPRGLDAPALTVPGRYSSRSLAVLAGLPLLWVDESGHRFADESAVYDFGRRGRLALEQGGSFRVVLDTATVAALADEGLELAPAEDHGAPTPEGSAGTPAQPRLVEALGEAVDQGAAAMGASLEELAGAAGLPALPLAGTVAAYNRAVATGLDPEFRTPEPMLLRPVSQAPFYAVRVVATVRGTLGGIRIDAAGRVLDPQGIPVPGVFAGGNEASGFAGRGYPQIDGLTLAFAFGSGRLAGESAAAWLREQE